jgi:hypothetical protein
MKGVKTVTRVEKLGSIHTHQDKWGFITKEQRAMEREVTQRRCQGQRILVKPATGFLLKARVLSIKGGGWEFDQM